MYIYIYYIYYAILLSCPTGPAPIHPIRLFSLIAPGDAHEHDLNWFYRAQLRSIEHRVIHAQGESEAAPELHSQALRA